MPDAIARLEWSRRTELRAEILRHPVVHLQRPGLDAAGFLEVAASLGTPQVSPRANFQIEGHPEIIRMGNLRDERGERMAGSALSFGWHTDNSYRPHPPEFTLLYAIDVPRRGGDTEFVSLYDLHDSLDRELVALWKTYEVEHVTRSGYIAEALDEHRAFHPLVSRHPESGRGLVYASPGYSRRICGLDDATSARVLAEIADAIEPLKTSHRWEPGDLIVWDNRAAAHRATAHDPAEPRLLWRVLVSANAVATT